jgi:antitoxin ParD1/3/4
MPKHDLRDDGAGRAAYGALCAYRAIDAARSLAMNVSVGKHWEEFIDSLVKQGRYASATEVMREGLRLVEERETKLKALRETIQAAIAEGGAHSAEDVRAHIEEKYRELKAVREADARVDVDRRRPSKFG